MNAGKIIGNILKYGPLIVEAAAKIYEKIKEHFPSESSNIQKPPGISLENLSDRISDLEKSEVEQAELVQKIASQLNDISIGLKVLYDRIIISSICSGVAVLLAIIALVFCFLK